MEALQNEIHVSNKELTEDDAIRIASDYGLETEIQELLDSGYSPEEALEDWDILSDEFYESQFV